MIGMKSLKRFVTIIEMASVSAVTNVDLHMLVTKRKMHLGPYLEQAQTETGLQPVQKGRVVPGWLGEPASSSIGVWGFRRQIKPN